jgi:hypothetical protein
VGFSQQFYHTTAKMKPFYDVFVYQMAAQHVVGGVELNNYANCSVVKNSGGNGK